MEQPECNEAAERASGSLERVVRRDTGQPHLDRLFNAAVECAGDLMPDNWEAKGRRHLEGKCGNRCKAPNADISDRGHTKDSQ